MNRKLLVFLGGALASLLLNLNPAVAQGNAFSYQGRLNNDGAPASGSYDLAFALYATNAGGSPVAGPVTNLAVVVTNGLFTTLVDFTNAYAGGSNWLQIAVSTNGANAFAALSPRQQLTPVPYAIFAESASNVLGVVSAGQLSGLIAPSQLPASVVTNNAGGLTLAGTFTGNGTGLANVNAAALNGLNATNFWQLGGNNVAPGAFLGSTNNQYLELWVNGGRALRLQPTANDANHVAIVNVLGGSSANYIQPGTYGAVIAGGGANYYFSYGGPHASNTVASDMSFIGSGFGNTIQANSGYLASFVGAGYDNSIQGYAGMAFVGAGFNNSIQGVSYQAADSFLGGGEYNSVHDSVDSFLGAGDENAIQTAAHESVLAGGEYNTIQPFADHSFLGGGNNNSIGTNASYSFLGGGRANAIQTNSPCSLLGGGGGNFIEPNAAYSVLGGGFDNAIQVGAPFSFLGGGSNNVIADDCFASVVGGGDGNVVAGGDHSVIGGGELNSITFSLSDHSFIGSGYNNTMGYACADSFIGAGQFNSLTIDGGESFIGGGDYNTNAYGFYCVIPGGFENYASGDYSFAAGQQARANYQGDFVWADSQDGPFNSTATDQFLIRAQGGVGINKNNPSAALDVGGTVAALTFYGNSIGLGVSPSYSVDVSSGQAVGRFTSTGSGNGSVIELKNTTASSSTLGAINFNNAANGYPGQIAYTTGNSMTFRAGGAQAMVLNTSGLTVNGTFVSASDRNLKENFQSVSARDVLAKVAALPVSRWNYKQDKQSEHIGPMAQDFYAAFNVGPDDRHIATIDEGGVALAAIQGLNQKLQDEAQAKDAEITELKKQNESLAGRLNDLEAMVKQLANPK